MKNIFLFILALLLMSKLGAQDVSLQKFNTNLKLETLGAVQQLFIWPGYFNTLELEIVPREWEQASLQLWAGGFYKNSAQLFGFISLSDRPVSRKNTGYQVGAGYRRYLSPFNTGKREKWNGNFYVQPTVAYQRWRLQEFVAPGFDDQLTSINLLVHFGGQFRLKKRWIADVSTGWGYQLQDPTGILIAEYLVFHPRLCIGYELR